MTDGNETYRIRWEGTLTEGKAIVVTAADKKLVNEDIQRMKALFGYKPQDTLGLVKGNARIDENKVFGENLAKFKKLLGESEEIEGQEAEKEAPFEEADIKQAPEAKAHVEGAETTSFAKGTMAPKPKQGEWEKISVPQAGDAKKHIEGAETTSFAKGTMAPKPKEGHWEDVSKKAPEATEHMESGKSTSKATDKAKVVAPAKSAKTVNENMDGDEDADVEVKDTWNKPEEEDSMDDKEPTSRDIKPEVPALDTDATDDDAVKVPTAKAGATSLAFSPKLGVYWIKGPGLPLNGMAVPDSLTAIAADKTKKGSERANLIIAKMQTMDEPVDDEEGIEEYGDEHAMATQDAVAGMKPGMTNEGSKKKSKSVTEKGPIDEFFGLGKKVIDLNTLKPSADAVAFVTRHPASKGAIGEFLKKFNMDNTLASKAVEAVYDYAKGIPMLSKYGFTFDPQTNRLQIDPNKGGLFATSPFSE
jgi:hypothetical protein